MNNYLDQFPTEHQQFIKDKFYTAYVFTEETYEFGEEDTIQLAKGPKEMKTRLTANLEKLLLLGPSPDQVQLIEQILPTVDASDSFLMQVKKEIDGIWQKSRDYQINHPKKERQKATPPSESQLNFLKNLGCTDKPKSRAEASRMIDVWKNK